MPVVPQWQNSRNGKRAKMVLTETACPVKIEVPRQPPCKLVIAEQEGWTSAKCHVSL